MLHHFTDNQSQTGVKRGVCAGSSGYWWEVLRWTSNLWILFYCLSSWLNLAQLISMCKQRLLLSSRDVGVQCILKLIRFSQSVQNQHHPVRGFQFWTDVGVGGDAREDLLKFGWNYGIKMFCLCGVHTELLLVSQLSITAVQVIPSFQELNLNTVKLMHSLEGKVLVKTQIFQLLLVWYFYFAPLSVVMFLLFDLIPLGD